VSESAQTFPVAVVADVHLGNHQLFGGSTVGGMNRRCRLGLDTFKRAVQEAQRHGAQTFIVAGDLYDTVLPPPQLLAATIDVFNQMQESVYLVPGNHDAASSLEDDHALGPLGRAPGVYVVNRTMLAEYTALCVPYAPGRATEWLDDGIRKHCAPSWPSRTLITHVGVADANTHPELRKAHDAVEASWLLFEMETHGLHRAVVGNWHNHAVWTSPTSDTTIIQAGALVPTGFDNPGLTDYGSLILLDPMSGAWKREVIPGPRFLKLGPEDVPDLEACVAGAIAAHTIGTGKLRQRTPDRSAKRSGAPHRRRRARLHREKGHRDGQDQSRARQVVQAARVGGVQLRQEGGRGGGPRGRGGVDDLRSRQERLHGEHGDAGGRARFHRRRRAEPQALHQRLRGVGP
jgi:hypothetical protein